jgi:glycyl-tRNA synthetase (class II)
MNQLSLPFGIVNIYNEEIKSVPDVSENSKNASEHQFINISNYSQTSTSLNAIYFFNKNRVNEYLVNWQRKRKKWFLKFMSLPENIHLSIDNEHEMNFVYKFENKFDLKIETMIHLKNTDFMKEGSSNAPLDSVQQHHQDLIKGLHSIVEVIKSETPFKGVEDIDVLVVKSRCEDILESILFDSFQIRDKNISGKDVFRLDIRLAPYKACILIKSNIKENVTIAADLKKMFYFENISVFSQSYENDEDLKGKFDYIDQLGVPFAIVMPHTLKTDGVCLVRYRETTLLQKLHFSQIVKHFKEMMVSLDAYLY